VTPVNPRRFLITGGAGFIGSHLSTLLIERGHTVLVIDDLSTGRLENVTHLSGHPSFHLARASIMDHIVMDRLASQADVIVHLAAAVGVKLIVERAVHTIETNVMGTEAVLKSALRYGCRVLLASTSEVYGKGHKLPFAEDDDVLLGATSRSRWSYGATKMVDEFLGLAYHREHGLPVVVARLFNTSGARQTGAYGMVVPRFVRQALQGVPITIYGDGTQRRCFCHVSDVALALVALAEHPAAPGRVFNVGATDEISIRSLAERVREMTGSQATIVAIPYEEAYSPGFEDMTRRIPDTTRIHQLTGWRASRSIDDILRDVIAHERPGLPQVPADPS
jgi:UDP-glucose 4-epimerase